MRPCRRSRHRNRRRGWCRHSCVGVRRDAAGAAPIAKGAGDDAGQRHRLRPHQIGQLNIRLVATGDRTDAQRHLGLEMRVGEFLNAMRTGMIEASMSASSSISQTASGEAATCASPLSVQSAATAFDGRAACRLAMALRPFLAMHEGGNLRRRQRQIDRVDAKRIGDRVGEADRRAHAIAFADAFGAERRERRRRFRNAG